MLKVLLISMFCFFQTQYLIAQEFVPFKDNAPLTCDLYWTKGFDYLEDDRFSETLNLIENLVTNNLGRCENLRTDYLDLKKTLIEKDKIKSENALTRFIITGILIDLAHLNIIDDELERRQTIQILFKELIAIQKYVKRLNFDTYRDLVISFRRLNQLFRNKPQINLFIDNNLMIQKILEGC